MKAILKNNILTLTVPMLAEAKPSSSGKTRVVATASSELHGVQVGGRGVKASVTAYVYPEKRAGLSGKQTGVKVEVEKPAKAGEPANLVLKVPTMEPRISGSGKSKLIASVSGGTSFMLGEREVMVNVNAFIPLPKSEQQPPTKGAAAE